MKRMDSFSKSSDKITDIFEIADTLADFGLGREIDIRQFMGDQFLIAFQFEANLHCQVIEDFIAFNRGKHASFSLPISYVESLYAKKSKDNNATLVLQTTTGVRYEFSEVAR